MKYGYPILFDDMKAIDRLVECLKKNARQTVGPGKEIGFAVVHYESLHEIAWRHPSGDGFNKYITTT
jgi:hypothetical protein